MDYQLRNTIRIIIGTLALLATVVFALIFRIETPNAAPFIITAIVTAILINIPVPVAGDDRSLVHVVGLAALLFYDTSLVILALAFGFILGSTVRIFWSRTPAYLRGPLLERLGVASYEAAHPLVAHIAAAISWRVLGGIAPVEMISLANAVPVAGLVSAHIILDTVMLLIGLRLRGREAEGLETGGFRIGFALTELVPIPFALFGATLMFSTGVGAFTLYAALDIAIVIVLRYYARTTLEAQRRYEEVASLSNVSRALRTSLDLNALLDMIYLQVAHLLRVENFYIALYDANDDLLSFSIAVRDGKRVQWKSRPAASRLTDHVIRTAAPLVISHDMKAYLSEMGMDVSGEIPYGWMGVPLMSSDRAIGCMAVLTYNPGESITPDMLSTFSAIAAQAGVAIENAQLYGDSQRRGAELRTLTEISSLLSSTLNPEIVLEVVSNAVLEVFNSHKVAIFLMEKERDDLFLARAEKMTDAYLYSSLTLPITDSERVKAFKTGEPQIVEDINTEETSQEMRDLAKSEDFQAYVDVPLQAHGEIIGFLAMYFPKPRRFRASELELLTTFASQAALAVANARVYAVTDLALTRKVDQLETLEEIGRELASTLEIEGLFNKVLLRAMEATNASAGTLTLRGDHTEGLRLVAYRGYATEQIENYAPDGVWPIHQGVIGRVMRTGQMALVPDVANDPDFIFGSGTTLSHLSVPIQRELESLGVISVESDDESAFSEEDADIVTQLAVQAAVALSNAQLYETAQSRLHELSILYEASAEISSTLETQVILNAVAASLAAAADARLCSISELDPIARTLVEVAHFSRDGAEPEEIGRVYSLDDYPASMRVLTDREPLFVRVDDPNADKAERRLLQEMGEGVLLALPIIASDHAVGLIELYDNQPREFSANILRVLRTLASQAGVAFENARLFERVSKGLERLAAILNSTRDGVLMIDEAGLVVLANPRLEEYWGVAREDFIGQPLDELAARDDNALDIDALLGLLSGELEELLQSVRAGTALPAVKVPFHIDEPLARILERTIVPVKDESGKVFGQLIVLRDISEEKELEEAREDLSSMIVHDLRSPMTSVLGSLKLLEEYLPETEVDDFMEQAVEVGLRSSQRLLMLVDSLLDISRLESGTVDLFLESVDLNTLVHNVMLSLNPLASEQDIYLNNQVPLDLAPVRIDRDKLERVLINLIDNALKFTPTGSSAHESSTVLRKFVGRVVVDAAQDWGLLL